MCPQAFRVSGRTRMQNFIQLRTRTQTCPTEVIITQQCSGFLSRVSTETHDIHIAILSVCPSVCLSTQLMGLLLRDRRFQVHMGNDTSSWRPQRNGLPQGSVPAPVLFNLYSNNLSVTRGRKFIYTDDICLAVQGQYFSELECSLSSDMAWMSHFCRQWWLTPSASKTISSVFHLHNTSATRELEMWVRGHSWSLKVVPFETIGTVSYSHSIVTMAISLTILETHSIKEWPDLEIWLWGHSRSLKKLPFNRPFTTFYWSAIVTIVVSCTVFHLFDVK